MKDYFDANYQKGKKHIHKLKQRKFSEFLFPLEGKTEKIILNQDIKIYYSPFYLKMT